MRTLRPVLLATIGFLAALIGTSSATAEGPAAKDASDAKRLERGLEWAALETQLGIRAQVLTNPSALEGVHKLPMIGGEAFSGSWSGLRLWARGAGFAVGRRSAGYGLQGGAAIPLLDGIDLTASYRLTGFATGARLDPELSEVDDRSSAPYVGLAFAF